MKGVRRLDLLSGSRPEDFERRGKVFFFPLEDSFFGHWCARERAKLLLWLEGRKRGLEPWLFLPGGT